MGSAVLAPSRPPCRVPAPAPRPGASSMTTAPGSQPYPSAEATTAAFADHVNRGKVAMFEAFGLGVVMGERSGVRFSDAFDGRRFVNCHCNGGVFNLGHRNPRGDRRGPRSARPPRHRQPPPRLGMAGPAGRAARGDHRRCACPRVVFGVGGGEAIDLALKLARAHTGRPASCRPSVATTVTPGSGAGRR